MQPVVISRSFRMPIRNPWGGDDRSASGIEQHPCMIDGSKWKVRGMMQTLHVPFLFHCMVVGLLEGGTAHVSVLQCLSCVLKWILKSFYVRIYTQILARRGSVIVRMVSYDRGPADAAAALYWFFWRVRFSCFPVTSVHGDHHVIILLCSLQWADGWLSSSVCAV